MIFGITSPWGIALFILVALFVIMTFVRIINIFIHDAKLKKYTPSTPLPGSDSIKKDGYTYYYQTSQNNLHIQDSWVLQHSFFKPVLVSIKDKYPESDIWKRSIRSMCKEWATHNLLYLLGIKKNQTQDVDLNYPQKWYIKAVYWITGSIASMIIL